MVDPIHVKPSDFFGSDPLKGTGKAKEAYSSKSKESSSKPVHGKDEVVISQLAQDIQLVKKHLDDVPQQESDRLKTIRDQVKNGTYKIDSGKIAGKIIHDHKLDKLI